MKLYFYSRVATCVAAASLTTLPQCGPESKNPKQVSPDETHDDSSSKSKSYGGFKDVVKNPSYLDESARIMDEVDQAVKEADSWSDERLADIVYHFIFGIADSDDAWGLKRVLRSEEKD